MTTPLVPGYSGIPDEATLGFICWFSISEPRVTADDVANAIQASGMTVKAPGAPRTGDAFKRACRESERKKVPLNSEAYANALIRSVAQSATEVERHLVIEVVDEKGKRLSYETCAELRLDRTTGKLHVRQYRLDPERDQISTAVLKDLVANFDDAQTYIEAQVLRYLIREQLKEMHAVNVRPYGGVYFFPISQKQLGLALDQFTKSLGPDCIFHSLPLINVKEQREMLKAAFETSIHDEATQLAGELHDVVREGKKMTAAQFATYKKRHTQLMRQVEEYRGLTEDELDKANTEMDLLNGRILRVFEEDLIKT